MIAPKAEMRVQNAAASQRDAHSHPGVNVADNLAVEENNVPFPADTTGPIRMGMMSVMIVES